MSILHECLMCGGEIEQTLNGYICTVCDRRYTKGEKMLDEFGIAMICPHFYKCEKVSFLRGSFVSGSFGCAIGKKEKDAQNEHNTQTLIEPCIIQWINVKEKLPSVINTYLVTIKQKYQHEKEWEYNVDVATYVDSGGYIDDRWDTYNDWIEGQETHVTHWAMLPGPFIPQKHK